MAFSAKARRAALMARRRNNQLRREGKLPQIKGGNLGARSNGNTDPSTKAFESMLGASSKPGRPGKEAIALRLINLLEKVLQ